MVFSGVTEGSGGNGYTGYVTGGAMSVIGPSTDVDDGGRDTGATLGDIENGTWEETKDVTLQGTDRVLIGCEGAALT